MRAEIHIHTAARLHGALQSGSLRALHPESLFIKNTLPKPPFIIQACAFNPLGVDLSKVLNISSYTHPHADACLYKYYHTCRSTCTPLISQPEYWVPRDLKWWDLFCLHYLQALQIKATEKKSIIYAVIALSCLENKCRKSHLYLTIMLQMFNYLSSQVLKSCQYSVFWSYKPIKN